MGTGKSPDTGVRQNFYRVSSYFCRKKDMKLLLATIALYTFCLCLCAQPQTRCLQDYVGAAPKDIFG